MADLNLTPARDATSSASSSTLPSHGNTNSYVSDVFIFPSHGNTNSYVYDVFINHHGTDVKEGLASHIYHRLVACGLRVFWDQHELQQGDNMTGQVVEAILTASVRIAIFTPTYAESSRCLDELVLMLESRSRSRSRSESFVPVFYKVKTTDLRWMRGAQSLGVLENKRTDDSLPRYDSSIIEKWRRSLLNATNKSYFELKACNDDEGKLVDKVVERVLITVRKPPLNVAGYGLDEKIEDVERTLSLQPQSGGVRVVGIVGLVGIGKTTLAKAFFNRQRSHYKRSCFLADVRSRNSRSLHSIFLKFLIHSNVQIDSVDEGKKYLSSSNKATNALIVLDDVDHIDQLDALFSLVKDTIHPDSLMLVTSRYKDVLTSSGIAESSIYKVEGLNAQHSRELFCLHAFGIPHPDKGFDEVVKKFLDLCVGWPLALEVVGARLRGPNDLGYWNEQLHKLSGMLPSDILRCLKASYDGLDGEEKKMFLDIACFFIGEDRDTAIRVWDASGWKGSLGLRKLEDRFLVEIDSKYRIRMYDPLRHLGKDLAEEEPPGCELRVWRHNLSAQSPVRGISMVYRNLDQQFWEKVAGSCNLSRLQLLRVRGYSVESIFSVGQLPQLTYLRWENCPNSVLPSWNPLKNLRVLHIQGKNLGTLWQRESQAPLQLRELNMDAPLLEVPKSIGKLKHLEKFVLHQSNLETLPDEFCHVDSLIHVELKNCQKIRLLPDSVGNLTNLQRLDLSKCSNLEMLPYSLGNLRNLQHINLSKCSNLRMLPNFLDNLKHLQHMDLSGCSNLQILPNSLGNLKNLQHIDLSRCLNLQMLPNCFGNLTNLQHIELSGCSNLPILPNSFGNLIQLKHLCLRKCYDLTISSETLGQIRTLEWLEISGCYGIDVLPPQITHQRFLREMYLFCPFLKELPSAIGDLSHLEVLHLTSSCLELLEIGTLVSLEKLKTCDCVTLKSIQGLAQLTKLRTLDVTNCPVLEELPGVEHLRSLKECGASGCPKQVQEQLETALSISRM